MKFRQWVFFIIPVFFSLVSAQVPDWAKDAIWYQIFPERFYNGDPFNDPAPQDMTGAWPHTIPDGWRITPWTDDWYKRQPWEKGDFYRITATRRYGGDLQGVLLKLDYLKALGINAIYFNPLFESPSHHKYDASMYHHIDNNFGPDPEKDRQIWSAENPADPSTWQWTTADSLFLKLIQEAHTRGIRIIVDGVFNHVGMTFWAFQDIVRHQQKSPYANWFDILSFDDPETPGNEFDYKGWIGIKDLPEFREIDGNLVPEVKDHIFAVVRRWMDPNGDGDPSDGIDGWRLDVAEMIGHPFWREFRQLVKSINPDAYITGEIWWEDYSTNKMFNAAPWLQGDQFDGVMNYRFTELVKNFIADQKTKITAEEFGTRLMAILADYPIEHVYVLQNLLSSHDVERFVSGIVNPDRWLDHGGRSDWNPDWDNRKPTELEYRKFKLAIALQMTLPGAPMIYYGDEAGMWGGDDPDCRKPMVWPEFFFSPETHHPLGIPRNPDSVKFNKDLYSWYKALISLRHQYPALRVGRLQFLPTDDPDFCAFQRFLGEEEILVLINSGSRQCAFLLKYPYTNLLGSGILQPGVLSVGAYSARILKRR